MIEKKQNMILINSVSISHGLVGQLTKIVATRSRRIIPAKRSEGAIFWRTIYISDTYPRLSSLSEPNPTRTMWDFVSLLHIELEGVKIHSLFKLVISITSTVRIGLKVLSCLYLSDLIICNFETMKQRIGQFYSNNRLNHNRTYVIRRSRSLVGL